MQDVLYKILVSGHWMGEHKETGLRRYCTACRHSGAHNFESLEHAFADCAEAAEVWKWAIGRWNEATMQQLDPGDKRVTLLADRGEAAQALTEDLWRMVHTAVIWELYVAAKKAREAPLTPRPTQGALRQAICKQLQRLVDTAWEVHHNRSTMRWHDWHQEHWIETRSARHRKPLVRVLTAEYAQPQRPTARQPMSDDHNAVRIYTDGSWVDTGGGEEWQPATWGAVEFHPTDSTAASFPMGQLTSAGPAETARGELTWVSCGTVVTEPDERHYIGAHAHTNNTGELTAMSWALQRAQQAPAARHEIYSDSLYTINMTTGKWVPRARGKRNAHLIAKLRKQYRSLQRTSAGIAIRHVRSHIKVPGNELADHVADMARGGGVTLQAARAWLVAWVGRQQMPGGLGDRTGVG